MSCLRRRQSERLDLEQDDVASFVHINHRHVVAVAEHDRGLALATHDMQIGHDDACRLVHDAGTCAAGRLDHDD